ncbi:hypothetical protein AGRA3207_003196 [Actinomadura graeca]|uniref:Effector-associated domain-containing protein n=1 Tax=Actinomadura graeca TaxID=2750812 RepID=A0ABX8QTU0_9ACTN|nr:hypothetical protein [Actinomadura graeca]QXJ22229.1 hypothetical protein AGRA3207_003196 [Actinomadura graeca]
MILLTISREGTPPSGNRAIVAGDIVGFGGRSPEHVQAHLREELYSRVRRALGRSGIPFDDCYREDRGDGLLLVLQPGADLDVLVTPVLQDLDAEIRRQNDIARPGARMRLRVALNVGPVRSDRYGVVGKAVVQTFRLLEAPGFKRRMHESGARLGTIISHRLYEDVVLPDSGKADPADHERLWVELKETRTWAWVRFFGVPDSTRARPGVVPDDVLSLAEELLRLPSAATQDMRTSLVGSLPDGLSGRIRRESAPIMDAYCILRPCVENSADAAAFLAALRRVSPGTPLGRFEQALTALPWLA